MQAVDAWSLSLMLALGLLAATPASQAEILAEETISLAASGEEFGQAISMTLPEAVLLAVRNNIGLRNAYLGQVVNKFQLWVSEGKFVPTGRIWADFNTSRRRAVNAKAIASESVALQPALTWKAPTGADFRFVWDVDGSRGNSVSDTSRSSLGVRVTQPLLKGAGVAINRISVDLARNQYDSSLQSLRATLSSTITQVIRVYRELMLARGQLEIERRALKRARSLVKTNRELIAAGRLAKQDLIQAESDVASREVALASSENGLDQTRLKLIGLLNLDSTVRIRPTEPVEVVDVPMDQERFLAIALKQRPDYIRARLTVADNTLNQQLAENNSEWTLNLTASSGVSTSSDHWMDPGLKEPFGEAWSVGVNLVVPLFDRSLREQRVRADVALRQARNSLLELRASIEREILDAIRNVDIQRRQVDLSRRSRELKEKQLAVEREKLNLGRSTNFQVVQYQNELVDAQNAELSVIASYLNALTDLDETLGTTLATWQIEIADLPIPAGP